MTRLYIAPNSLSAGLLKGALEDRGIHAHLRGLQLSGALGELPPVECQPEVWLEDDSQLEEARLVLADFASSGAETTSTWTCRACGETVPSSFATCWACPATDPSAEGFEPHPTAHDKRTGLSYLVIVVMAALGVLVLLDYGGAK